MKHVKENDLAHGEFGKWLESINMHHDTANKMMKIANELNSNSYTYMNLGSRALYEIATLPEPERAKEHTTSNGEIKTPDEMTVRELRELKKQLKQRDEQNAQLQSQVEQAHLTTKTPFHLWLYSMYTRTVALYLHNMISTINNSITKACTGTISP